MITNFQNIIAWKKAHELTLTVYRLSASYPQSELFNLTAQTRRCAVSVPSNIAEGYRRNGSKDSLHFYNIAQASLEEMRYQLLLAKDLLYMSQQEYLKVSLLAEETSKVLTGWVKSQRC